MVIDKIENLTRYKSLHPLFHKAFKYLTETDLNTLSTGKHIIDGEDVFAILMEYQTKDTLECPLEGHRKYIDVQYILSGEEHIGFASLKNQKPHQDDTEADYAFYQDPFDFLFKLKNKSFAIFFPTDLHAPCIKINESLPVRKIVVKVKA